MQTDDLFPPSPFDVEDEPPASEPAPEPAIELPPNEPVIVLFERFAALHLERMRLKEALEENGKKMERLQEPLRSFFLAHPKHSHDALGVNVYLKREIWVHPRVEGGKQQVCDALRATGLGHYVSDDYNASSVSKYVRDLERLHADDIKEGIIESVADVLPAPLVAVLNVDPTLKVQGRRSTKKSSL